MNPETLNLIERPFREVVDDILVALVGGVVNEPIFFDLKADLYPLAEPAADVRGITGTLTRRVNGSERTLSHSFQKGIDFEYNPDQNAVVWLEGGTRPDDETQFFVDYFRPETDSPLTDINVGSVTRTLSEAIGREIATVYQQINRAYLSGFIDTAEGTALDLVVAILGLKRKNGDFAVGLVTFFRDPEIQGNITIPDGTLLATAKGEAAFETTQLRTLHRGQARIDVPVRAADAFPGQAGRVDAAAITEMAQPIAGIARVTNFEATFLGAGDETDAELRARAKAALRALGKATLAALAKTVFEGRGTLLEAWDPNGPPAKRSPPGSAVLLIEAEPERFPSLRAAVHETRAAGVELSLVARYVFFTPKVVATIAPGLTPAGKEKVVDQVIAALQAYVDGLTSGDPAEGAALLDAVKGAAEEVSAATIVDVITARSDIAETGAPSLLDALVGFVPEAPADDPDALREALQSLLEESPALVPGSRRIPDRSLARSSTGEGPATDEEIEAGEFQVVSVVDGENWWVVLDIAPAHVLLLEEGG
jgi:hypothetical protein